ncbi:ZPR1 zinc-finger domain-containing protein, partial [Ochromonadaceae sp. CCMP2298]
MSSSEAEADLNVTGAGEVGGGGEGETQGAQKIQRTEEGAEAAEEAGELEGGEAAGELEGGEAGEAGEGEGEGVTSQLVEEGQGLQYDEWNGVDIMRSMCMGCGEEGETRLMLHKIPYFRELIIASFLCDHCGERNNEVTFGGEIQREGCAYTLTVTKPEDLDRQLIKSDSALLKVVELDLEIPPMTQRGGISTLEGVLKKAAENLSLHQADRMEQSPEVGNRVAQVIAQLSLMANRFPGSLPFTLLLDDPAGNSFVENLVAPNIDPQLSVRHYRRTREQDIALGLPPEQDTGV